MNTTRLKLERLLMRKLPAMGVSVTTSYARAVDLHTPIGMTRLVKDKKGDTWRCIALCEGRPELCQADNAEDALNLLLSHIEKLAVEQLAAMMKSKQDA